MYVFRENRGSGSGRTCLTVGPGEEGHRQAGRGSPRTWHLLPEVGSRF